MWILWVVSKGKKLSGSNLVTQLQILSKFKNFLSVSVDFSIKTEKNILLAFMPKDLLESQIINLTSSGSQTKECLFVGTEPLSRIFTCTLSLLVCK